MTIDIDSFNYDKADFVLVDSKAPKVENLFLTQVGSLYYAPDFGVDSNFWLNPVGPSYQPEAYIDYLRGEAQKEELPIEAVEITKIGVKTDFEFRIAREDNTGRIRING